MLREKERLVSQMNEDSKKMDELASRNQELRQSIKELEETNTLIMKRLETLQTINGQFPDPVFSQDPTTASLSVTALTSYGEQSLWSVYDFLRNVVSNLRGDSSARDPTSNV